MINIAYPWVLPAIFLPFVLRLLLPKAANESHAALKIPFFKQLQSSVLIQTTALNRANRGSKYLWLALWVLVVVAGSGIEWLGKPLPVSESGRDLMLAVDLSGSMQTPDMQVNGQMQTRFQVVSAAASQFIQKRQGDRLGLILFGTRPYLQTPLTFDRTTVSQMLNDASVGIAGTQTAIGDAIGLAIKQLMNSPGNSKALILLTDGGNNAGVLDPLQAAELAQKEHIKIYTIGLGASQMTVQTLFGTQTVNPSSDLDVKGLQEIARITGGEFFRAEDGQSLNDIYSAINHLEPVQSAKITIRPRIPFYPYPLGAALILSMLLVGLSFKRSAN